VTKRRVTVFVYLVKIFNPFTQILRYCYRVISVEQNIYFMADVSKFIMCKTSCGFFLEHPVYIINDDDDDDDDQ